MIELEIINKLADFKYPDLPNRYGLSDKAIFTLFRIYKKKVNIDDVIDIFELLDVRENRVSIHDKNFIIRIIRESFNMNTKITDEIIDKIYPHFKGDIKNFVKFINDIADSNDIFSGGDISITYNTQKNDLLNCRSYKIYKITNE